MKKFYELSGYEQWIEIREGQIVKSSCTCIDFIMRRIKSIKLNKDEAITKTIQCGVCKHLKEIYGNIKNEERTTD